MKEPTIPKDTTESVTLARLGAPPKVHVQTYKTAVTMTTSGEVVWLSADEAERLGHALMKAAKHRRRIDAAEKAHQKWWKSDSR